MIDTIRRSSAARARSVIGAPQLRQNRAAGGFSCPHAGQLRMRFPRALAIGVAVRLYSSASPSCRACAIAFARTTPRRTVSPSWRAAGTALSSAAGGRPPSASSSARRPTAASTSCCRTACASSNRAPSSARARSGTIPLGQHARPHLLACTRAARPQWAFNPVRGRPSHAGARPAPPRVPAAAARRTAPGEPGARGACGARGESGMCGGHRARSQRGPAAGRRRRVGCGRSPRWTLHGHGHGRPCGHRDGRHASARARGAETAARARPRGPRREGLSHRGPARRPDRARTASASRDRRQPSRGGDRRLAQCVVGCLDAGPRPGPA